MPSDWFLHEHGLCDTPDVGPGTRIWGFSHVLPGARIGADCNIAEGVFIENDVVLGDRVTVKCGVQLWDGIEIEDDVFIGPNATFTNDRFPRSKVDRERLRHTVVRRGASIGANATILPGIEIGSGAMVGAGAVVTRSIPPHAIAVGNPARIIGYAGVTPAAAPLGAGAFRDQRVQRIEVGDATLHELPQFRDMRGSLAAAEFERDLPFVPSRCFLVFDVPGREVRGEHAHRECHQFLICVHGSCSVMVDDGRMRRDILMDRPTLGLHIPPMIWGVQYRYSPDAVLLVFASHPYNASDYIRDYDEFCGSARGADGA
jgi:UDP-2-acetamido-3-amino-2,3-dideoxy-glucuronate N-acetyltransferase